ncbi:MAG: DUF1080 domain-containing protein [Planctomycetota bacterium]
MRDTFTAVVLALAFSCFTPAIASADDHLLPPWQDLFNGRDLSGWVSSGADDAWGVDSGEIVTLKPGTGGWLRTDRAFRDFELMLSFWLPENGNSGVGLRGSSGGDPAFTGFEVQIFDSAGQTPDVRNCGAVYEAIPADSMAVTEAGNWNTYRIRLVGDVLDVWLNGTRIHDGARLDDRGFFRGPENPLPLRDRATTGYIALQDHGHAFRFKDIRVRDLSPDPEPSGMQHLIPAGDRDAPPQGWFSEDAGEWSVEDGALVGRGGPGHIFSEATFANFELRALVRINTRGNSGLYFRVRPNPAANVPWPIGYEAQVDQHDPRNFTGVVYDRAWSDAIGAPITHDNAWFDYRVRAEGDRIRTWINGVAMVDAFLSDLADGHIAVQGHHPGSEVMVKDLRILELD